MFSLSHSLSPSLATLVQEQDDDTEALVVRQCYASTYQINVCVAETEKRRYQMWFSYLAPFDGELVKADPVRAQEPRVLLRVRLRAQVPGRRPRTRAACQQGRQSGSDVLASANVSCSLHDGAQVEGEQEAEVGGVREARAEDAVVDHGEVERRHQGVVGAGVAEEERELRVAPRLSAEDGRGHCLAALLCVLAALLPRRDIQLHGTH
jgi:hypothetical protein